MTMMRLVVHGKISLHSFCTFKAHVFFFVIRLLLIMLSQLTHIYFALPSVLLFPYSTATGTQNSMIGEKDTLKVTSIARQKAPHQKIRNHYFLVLQQSSSYIPH